MSINILVPPHLLAAGFSIGFALLSVIGMVTIIMGLTFERKMKRNIRNFLWAILFSCMFVFLVIFNLVSVFIGREYIIGSILSFLIIFSLVSLYILDMLIEKELIKNEC